MNLNEAVRSAYGAWLMFRREPMGLSWFDASEEGFWRSFQVAFLAAPAYAVMLLFDYVEKSGLAHAPHPVRFFLVQAIAYVISWVAFPLLMVHLARIFDWQKAYFRYMVAYNWGNLIVIGISLPVALLAASGALPAGVMGIVRVAALVLILSYQGFIARHGLKVPPLTAGMIVGVDFTLGLFIISIAEAMG
jgi:hypothetical protein